MASPNLHGLARAAVRSFGQDEPAQRQEIEFEAVGQVLGFGTRATPAAPVHLKVGAK